MKPNSIDRRDMEPPDAVYHNVLDKYKMYFAQAGDEKFFTVMSILKVKTNSLRLRGGGDPVDKRFNDIPYLTSRGFKWNGLPCIDFHEKVMNVINHALGSILFNGSTLLQTAQMVDKGGIQGNPPRATAPQSVVDDSLLRCVKLYACILNYIDENSETYKMLSRDFTSDGVAVYWFLPAFGTIPTPAQIVKAREDTWHRMTFDTLQLRYTAEGYFKWVEIVSYAGRKLNKSGNQMKQKFIDGLPERIFSNEKHGMLHNVSHTIPATYGGLLGRRKANNAATAHPFAGQANFETLARAYFPDWMEKCQHTKSQIPRGLVREVEALCVTCDMEDIANMVAEGVTKDTQCFTCGGWGHKSRTVLDNGDVLDCPSKVNGTQPDKSNSEIESIKNKAMRRKTREQAKEIEELKDQLALLMTEDALQTDDSASVHSDALSEAKSTTSNRQTRRNTPNTSTTHGRQAFAADTDDSDDLSDEIDNNSQAALANAAMARKPKPFNKRRPLVNRK